MQLVAIGAQDIYLTGNPMITYFKQVYRRHTNFAMESVCQTFNNYPDFGITSSSLISRSGDLISSIYLQTTLPALPPAADANHYLTWTDDIGHHLIKQVDLTIGGQLIDRHYGDWLEIWAQLSVPAEQIRGYREMIGQDPRSAFGINTGLQKNNSQISDRTIYVPLQFWFCRNIGLALPLIALQHHEVIITIKFREANELISHFDTRQGQGTIPVQVPITSGLIDTNLWVDYIYLDVEERRRFAQITHEYLIEQLQLNTAIIPCDSKIHSSTIELNLNHTIKELIWVVQSTGAVSNGHVQRSNYTDRSSINFPNATSLKDLMYDVATTSRAGSNNFRAFTNPSHCRPPDSLNPVVSAKLYINGNSRFAEQIGNYFNKMQPYRYHTSIPESPGINVYSFALKPELHQPSGTCNFSRLNKAELVLTVRSGTDHNTHNEDNNITSSFLNTNGMLSVYGINYNIFRIMSGMGALAYAL